METVEIEILNPKVKSLLADLENLDLIRIEKPETTTKPERKFGAMPGLVVEIADDFDAPLDDFDSYS